MDIGIALIMYFTYLSFSGEQASMIVLAFFFAAAFIPDIDMLSYAYRRIKGSPPHSHRSFAHYPLLVIPLVFLCIVTAGVEVLLSWFLIVTLFLHFVHDTLWIGGGVKWLWPFVDNWYQFFVQTKSNNSRKHWIEEYYFSLNVVTVIEYSVFFVGVAYAVISSR